MGPIPPTSWQPYSQYDVPHKRHHDDINRDEASGDNEADYVQVKNKDERFCLL